MVQLVTRWGKEIEANEVLPEYPRPNLIRDSYLNLNGEWEYCINDSDKTDHYDGKILVPYSPETLLSGVGEILMPDQYLHYRKCFTLPEGFKKDLVLLHFGAVDQECEVFMNGTSLGIHKGGYMAFSFDITPYLWEGENELALWVTDQTEHSPHARGKQKLVKKGKYGSLFYTPQSGIWKTVWLESVSTTYIKDVKITPLYDESAVSFYIQANRPGVKAVLTVIDEGTVIAETEGETDKNITVKLAGFKSWTPDSPHLYDVRITLASDQIMTYFGMRKLSTGKDKNGILRFYLNNEPCFFNGILDQGYWPESLLTPPTDEALKYDIVKLKEMGYNTIRKHIKVEAERFYYYCDKLGMLVWQDMPNGGGEYNMVFVTYMPNASDRIARGVKDNHYNWFKREDAFGREQYYQDLDGMVNQLYNYPSIAVWVPFNEGWGQFDAAKATEKIRQIDNTRLINEACGWFDQNGGDMYSIHNYVHKLKVKPQKDRVVALTEYGGYAYPVEGHMACEKEFGYQHYHSVEELTANYKRLWDEEIYPNLERGLCSAIYTQTSDIEEEINGVFTYDRDLVKLDEDKIRSLNEKLYKMFKEMT